MSPRSSKQFEEIRQASQRKILDAALKLFALNGYHATSISQIAKEAGVAKGLIYNYFKGGKEHLVQAVIEDAMKHGDEIVAEIMKAPTAKGKLRVLIEKSFSLMVEEFEYNKLLVSLSLKIDQFPKMREAVMGKFESMGPLFKSLLEEAGIPDPEEEMHLIAAILDGVGLQYMVLRDTLPIEKIKAFLLKKYDL